MPPLTRQESRASIYSWWSDSNLLLLHGPTINLHAAAKPFMRLMYHRQTLDIIRKNCGSPLTTAALETYSSYFPWDYVSWATKAVILSKLADRTEFSEVEAHAVVDSPLFTRITPMLESPHPRAWSCSCRLLRSLVQYESIAPAVLELEPCKKLVFLLDDKHSGFICEATAALAYLSRWLDGAKGVVDAKALDHILRLLELPDLAIRRWACELAGCLASHDSTTPAVLQLKLCKQIVSLLGYQAIYALSQIARWIDGAKVVVNAKVPDYVLPLLESPNPDTRRWACMLMGNLTSHESTARAILELNLSVQLVSLLSHQAIYTLSRIAYWVDGTQAVVDAKALNHILRLLESPNPNTREWASELIGNLASRESTAPAVLQLKPCKQIVSLLEWIAQWVDGAKGVVDAKALDHVLRLLESPNPDTQRWACKLTGNLASHEFTAPAILKLNPSVQLMSSLGDEDYLVYQATYTLSQTARWVDGAKAVVDAKVLDHVLPLLESPNPDTRNWACVLVHGLASHGATAPAILQLKPIPHLEFLLQDPHGLIYDNVLSALEAIRQWPDGVAARTDSDGVVTVEA
ncbi:armadillo-type protein [Mycena olivaceomarginata]|nr:armadillo-type protein [Mycena olivaceomarginata]